MAFRTTAGSPFRPPPTGAAGPGAQGSGQSRLVAGLLLSVLVLVLGALAYYVSVARSLPDAGDLSERAERAQTTRILDRNGRLVAELLDPSYGRRTVVPLDRISPWLLQATIATEDSRFRRHAGVDPFAIGRAFWYAISSGRAVSGASTLEQQLVKQVFLTPERTFNRKLREAILAAEVARRYTKDQILELYVNLVYYGNYSYGIEAAAQTYFGKSAADLEVNEAALLAGLPQAPAWWDPYAYPDRAKRRQAVVLGLMVENGHITQHTADGAAAAPLGYQPVDLQFEAPHFTLLVRRQVERALGPELLSAGLTITSTLDLDLQARAETIVSDHIATLRDRGAENAAVVAMHPVTGDVLAYVGSADFNDQDIAGQIDMALAPRQPGSAIKPFVYAAAFEGIGVDSPWSPGTELDDVTTDFDDGAGGTYRPRNADGREHGRVTVREALASSYNIPAVIALQAVGTEEFKAFLPRFGFSSLEEQHFGLPAALGSIEVPLLELTAGYASLANTGHYRPPVLILAVASPDEGPLCSADSPTSCAEALALEGNPLPAGTVSVSPATALAISDTLADANARAPAFGRGSVIELTPPAAVKTGTTNDYRDSVTVGFTDDMVVGAWVGNADNRPMRDVGGIDGAAPIWRAVIAGDAGNGVAGSEATAPMRPFDETLARVATYGGHTTTSWRVRVVGRPSKRLPSILPADKDA